MSHQSASVMFVRAAALDTFPKAFQEYVNKYFKEMEIGGVRHYVAFRVLSLSHPQRKSNGVAPCHNCDVNYFGSQHGMGKGENLADWIEQKVKECPQDISDHIAIWDDGCAGGVSWD